MLNGAIEKMDKWLKSTRKNKNVAQKREKKKRERTWTFIFMLFALSTWLCMADGVVLPIPTRLGHHAHCAQQLHLRALSVPCWCLVHTSRRKAANDRIILAASCLFVEVLCGITLRPWQMQWEMSSKPYHSLCKQKKKFSSSRRNVKKCEILWSH